MLAKRCSASRFGRGSADVGVGFGHTTREDDEQEQEDQVLLPEGVQLAPRWQTSESGFEVTFAGESSDGQRLELSAERVVQAWQSGSYAVEGLDGGLAWLPQDWLERHGPILEQFVAARNASSGELPRGARPAAAALCQTLDAPPPPELAGLATLVDGFTSVPPATLPAGLQAVLRDYQRQGVDWLCLLRDAGIGALLADDMGLGKTLQTLCAITGRTLVIAPTSTLPNWAAELARFRPDLRVSLYHGPKRSLDAAADVTLTSYAVLRLDREALAAHTWDTLVLDEAQAIKEPTTATAAAAFSLPARWRVAMSGTPVENRLTELWSLSHFCNPGLLGGRKDFTPRHARRSCSAERKPAPSAARDTVAPPSSSCRARSSRMDRRYCSGETPACSMKSRSRCRLVACPTAASDAMSHARSGREMMASCTRCTAGCRWRRCMR